MNVNIETIPIYGATIFKGRLPDFDNHKVAVLEQIYSLYESEKGLSRSNLGGWQSNDKLHRNSQPELKWLNSVLNNLGRTCIKKAEGNFLRGGIGIGAMWANISSYGAWNVPHTHMPCEWVGVCYLKTHENPQKRGASDRPADGDILFFDTQQLGPQYRGHRPAFHKITPKEGEFIIFPGYLLHMVAPHLEQEDRVSMAFNFVFEQHHKLKM